ncbi:hypothetical protein BBJ28_00022031 [Nothophytophthora sp. Chile5]|nr:hypothetical protein BBJ28_00022031 [Nothophytophthora sp. Chile5]
MRPFANLQPSSQPNPAPATTTLHYTMLPPPTMMLVQTQMDLQAAKEAIPCTCGAKDFEKRKQQRPHAATSEAKRVANSTAATAQAAEMPVPHRSLWRKLLGKGPKCVCNKQRASQATEADRHGLIVIPAEYVGCAAVTVSGKRVPFSRDMQQRRRASWTPLDAIKEDD